MLLINSLFNKNAFPIKWSIREYMLRPAAHCKEGCIIQAESAMALPFLFAFLTCNNQF